MDKKIRSKTCNNTPNETHLASLCVSVIFGSLGGLNGVWTVYTFPIGINIWVQGIICALFGFLFTWMICKYWFFTAHEWYGYKSFAHRIYDAVGIVSAMGVFWLMW